MTSTSDVFVIRRDAFRDRPARLPDRLGSHHRLGSAVIAHFLSQISGDRGPAPDPDQASVVTVTFTPTDRGTRVGVIHDRWERHGGGAQTYRDDFTQAWPMALGRYRQATKS